MSPLRLTGSTSGYSQLDAPAVAGDQTFTLPGTGGTLDRLNRAGNILQVVSASYGTQVSAATSTYVDTGLTATITPTSATSKILVIANHQAVNKSAADTFSHIRLLRDSTVVYTPMLYALNTSSAVATPAAAIPVIYLDSPATTASTTYKTQFNAHAATVFFQSGSAGTSTITLMEVAA